MQNEESRKGLNERFGPFWTLHSAFCILHFRVGGGYWWYAFSPASIRIGSLFCRGGKGQVANSVKAHGGL